MFNRILHKWLHLPYRLKAPIKRLLPPRRETVVLLHGIGSSAANWREVTPQIEKTMNVICLDLLGFGTSPKPTWATYSVADQVRAIRHTLRSYGILGNITLVGHSLGALIAVEYAKRYPRQLSALVLCSMPLYTNEAMLAQQTTLWPSLRSNIYLRLYRMLRQRQVMTTEASRLAAKYLKVATSITLTEANWLAFSRSLAASIERQTTIVDAEHLRIPMTLLYGSYDVLIIKKYLRDLATMNPYATLRRVHAGHEINKAYAEAIADSINRRLPQTPKVVH
ncbi:MAG TPA: alpha/beta hydrolase [Candidatus Saccharimonadales bacterium]|jgi:pimeloyl-ACP methyl ester carboxylesterase|nr:alpha/beta hydrolase [Candidatus Saccharimonadales bacterium]